MRLRGAEREIEREVQRRGERVNHRRQGKEKKGKGRARVGEREGE